MIRTIRDANDVRLRTSNEFIFWRTSSHFFLSKSLLVVEPDYRWKEGELTLINQTLMQFNDLLYHIQGMVLMEENPTNISRSSSPIGCIL